MMELNLGTAPDADLIKDTTEANFMTDVVQSSQDVPIIVDFWAPWCGPCKTLGPMLEDAVRAAKGAVKMVKVNVDEAQMIAGQLQIQSIPTVYAFHKGQPVDGFQGAQPQSEIKAFVDRVARQGGGSAPGDELAEAVEVAEAMLEEGAVTDAAQTFAAILGEDPNHPGAYAGLVKAHIALGELDKAEAILNGAPAEISTSAELEAARLLNCSPQSTQILMIFRRVLIWRWRFPPMANRVRQSISFWSFSAVTANGTIAPLKLSFSRFSTL